MKNFYKVSNTIENGPRMDRQWSRISPINHRLWTVIAPMLLVAFGLFGVNDEMWGATHYGYAYAWPNTTSSGSSNAGGVYLDSYNQIVSSVTAPGNSSYKAYMSDNVSTLSSSTKVTHAFYAIAKDGYYFEGWYGNSSYATRLSQTSSEYSVKTSDNVSRYAKFAPVTVGDVYSNSTTPTALDVKDYNAHNATVVFNVSNKADTTSDFTYEVTGDGWAFSSWSIDNTNHRVTIAVTYTASTTTTQGNHTGTVTLTSKGSDTGTNSGTFSSTSATVTANVDLTPTISVDPTSYDFGMFTVGVDNAKSKTFTLTLNANAVTITTTDNASIAPFSVARDGNTLTVSYNPTSVGTGSYSKTLRVTATNGQASAISAYQDITLQGQAQATTYPTFTNNILSSNYYVDDDATIDLQSLWTSDNKSGAITYTILSFTSASGTHVGATTPAISSNRYLSLGKAGSVEVELSQVASPGFYAKKDTVVIPIKRNVTSFSGSAYNDLKVEDEQTADYTYTNTSSAQPTANSSDDFYYTIDDISFTNEAKNNGSYLITFNPADKKIIACNAGTGKITLRQKQTYKYTGDTVSFDVAVAKYDNAFSYSWKGTNKTSWTETMNLEDEAAFTFSTNNSSTSVTPTITQTKGNDEGNVVATYNQAQNKITTTYNTGEAKWTFHQDEDYKYKHADTTLTVTVDIKNCPTCYAYKNDVNTTASSLTEGIGWDIDSVAGTLTFNMRYNGTAAGDNARMWRMVSGNWTDAEDVTAPGKNYASAGSFPLDPHTTRLKFDKGGTLIELPFGAGSYYADDPYINTIRVTRLPWLKLENQGGQEIDTIFITKNIGTASKTGTFKVHISTCDNTVKLASNDSKVTLSESSLALTTNSTYDGGYLSQNITVTYTCNQKDTTDAIISVYTKYEHKTIVIHAITEADDQEIVWKDSYSADTVSLVVNGELSISDAASASSFLTPILYSTDNTEVIEIAEDRRSFKVVGEGIAHLTASQAGNSTIKSAEDTKVVRGTEKIIQEIVWNQSFTSNLSVGLTQQMTASVDTVDVNANKRGHSAEQTKKLYYTCPADNKVAEIVDSCYLKILAPGETTVTAVVESDAKHERATYTKRVYFRVAPDGCDNVPVYKQESTEEILFYIYDVNTPKLEKTFTIPEGETPDKLSFTLRGVSYGKLKWFDKNIEVYESSDGGVHWSERLKEVVSVKDGTTTSGEIQLSPTTNMVKLVRPQGGTGYHYIEDMIISRLQFLEAERDTIDLGNIPAGSVRKDSILFRYSDVKTDLTVLKGDGDETYNKLELESNSIEMQCGSFGDGKLRFTFRPMAVGPWSKEVTIKDNITKKSADVVIVANVTKGTQAIDWEPTQTTFYTVEGEELNAQMPQKSNRELDVTLTSGNTNVVKFSGTTATIVGNGTVQVTASCGENYNFAAADDVEHTFTINRTPTTIVTAPALPDVIYAGTEPSSIVLDATNASAKETIKNNEVSGTYAITNTVLNAGTADITIKFTPSNTDLYAPSTTTIENVTISKRTPTLTWENAPANVTYGNTATYTASSTSTEGAITYSIKVGGEYASIYASTGVLTVIEAGHTVTVQATQAESNNYVSNSITTTVTLNQATPTGYSATASDIFVGDAVSTSTITNTGIDGTWEWKEPSTTYSVADTYSVAAIFTPDGHNYKSVEVNLSLVVKDVPVVEPNKFTGAEDNDWYNSNNWTNGIPTGTNPDVIVSGALVIDEDKTVGALTIESTGSVTVVTNGNLTVTGVTPDVNGGYGDLHVATEGNIVLGDEANLKVRHFILDAKLGDDDNQAASGQVKGKGDLDITGEAYFQMSFDPDEKISYGWYDFTVPFAVNINGGIERINSSSDKVMVCGTDFLIMEADEIDRANGGKGWRSLNSGTLVPGKLYTIGFDDDVEQNTFRFIWNGSGEIANGATYAAQCAAGSDESLRGWNGLGNGMLCHGYIATNYKMQAYDHVNNTYNLVNSTNTFAVGSAFFIQVEDYEDVSWTAAEATNERPLYAPKRAANEVEEFRLNLYKEEGKVVDVLYVSASEEATDAYRIGHDLLKMGTITDSKAARMWATKGGKKLCDVEATLVNDEATTPLNLYAPNAGQYILAVEETPEDGTLYLTYNGNVIWDLTASPYVLDLTKGTTTGYGLRIEAANAPQITTGVEDVQGNGTSVRKVIIDNTMYIITPEGEIYNAIGKKVQ